MRAFFASAFSDFFVKNEYREPISNVFADEEKMIIDIRRSAALSGFTRGGYDERFSAPQRVLKLAHAGERQRYFLDYFQKLPEDDLKTFRSDTTVIGDLSFRAKLASVIGRLQIRRGRPCKNKEGQ